MTEQYMKNAGYKCYKPNIIDRQTDGWMDGWMDKIKRQRQRCSIDTDKCMYICIYIDYICKPSVYV